MVSPMMKRIFGVLVLLAAAVLLYQSLAKFTITGDLQPTSEHNTYGNRPAHYPDQVGTIADEVVIPSESELQQWTDFELLELFQTFTNSMEIFCRRLMRLGSLFDSGKEACEDKAVRPSKPCLIYSFGSNNQFSFEEEAVRFFGCEVHTFDPTLGNIQLRVPKGVTFHDLGLDGSVNASTRMSTLDKIRQQLGHTDTILDILKIDVEYSEWEAIPQMIESDSLKTVKQFIVEIHFLDSTKQQKIHYLQILKRLNEYGFRKFNRDKNLGKSAFVPQLGHHVFYFTEISYINTRFLGDGVKN